MGGVFAYARRSTFATVALLNPTRDAMRRLDQRLRPSGAGLAASAMMRAVISALTP